MKYAITAIFLAALLPLVGCLDGGGGSVDQGSGGQPPPVEPEPEPEPVTIQSLTGMAVPAETVADQEARANDIIFSRTNFFHLSPLYGNTNDPDLPAIYEPIRECGSIEGEDMYCDVMLSEDVASIVQTETLYVEHSDLRFDSILSTAEAVGTKNGITLLKSVETEEFESEESGEVHVEATTYGAWMEHSGFGVQTLDVDVADEGLFVTARYAMVGGDRNFTAPAGSATWRGLMVGTPATDADRGDLLQGDATLSYGYDTRTLDATFDNIKNIDRLAAHSVETVSFDDVQVREHGGFWTDEDHDFIWGNFYGPGHAETAGFFVKSDIIGAFGAKRQ